MNIIGMYKNNLVSDFHDTAKFMVEMPAEEKDGWEELAMRLNNLAKQADKIIEKEERDRGMRIKEKRDCFGQSPRNDGGLRIEEKRDCFGQSPRNDGG